MVPVTRTYKHVSPVLTGSKQCRHNNNSKNGNSRIKNQLDVTYYFIVLLIGSTCFGHYYAHHQELATIMLIGYHIGRFVLGLL